LKQHRISPRCDTSAQEGLGIAPGPFAFRRKTPAADGRTDFQVGRREDYEDPSLLRHRGGFGTIDRKRLLALKSK
jgi:hypothetical protein